MNTQQKEEYREERFKNILSELNQTSFDPKYREMLAQALSKVYVGIPLCSYTYSYISQGEFFKEYDSVGDLGRDGRWSVLHRGSKTILGTTRRNAIQEKTTVFSASPLLIPAIPFSLTRDQFRMKIRPSWSFPSPKTIWCLHILPRVNACKQADWNIELRWQRRTST